MVKQDNISVITMKEIVCVDAFLLAIDHHSVSDSAINMINFFRLF